MLGLVRYKELRTHVEGLNLTEPQALKLFGKLCSALRKQRR